MSTELNSPEHICQNLACKCRPDSELEFCNQFCEDLGSESSSDDRKCGCGHMACDYTKQMGNEQTFDASGS
jgi:hypothetical protein